MGSGVIFIAFSISEILDAEMRDMNMKTVQSLDFVAYVYSHSFQTKLFHILEQFMTCFMSWSDTLKMCP